MLTSDTGPRVPFENYPVYIGGGRGGGFYDADLALLLIFLQQGTLTHSKLTQYRPLVRIFSFSFKSKINLLPKSVIIFQQQVNGKYLLSCEAFEGI